MNIIKFSASAHSENPTKTIVKARNFTMIVDEPENLGGTNDGANPVEYLLAALAGCLNVLAHVVAGEMDIKLRGVKIDIEGDLDPSKFLGKSNKERAGYTEIRASIKPDTDADPAALEKWLETIEDRCPISDNISNQTPVKISLS